MNEAVRKHNEMCDFLTAKLKRSLTPAEIHFVAWLAQYEQMTYDQIFSLFRELADHG